MAHPFNKPLSKVSIKQLLSLEPEDIKKFTFAESRTYEKRLRITAQRRLSTISKYGKYSPAQERYLPKGLPELTTVQSTRNASQHNIAVLREFLAAKSSTLKGIREITKETEKRVFGVNSRGQPIRHFANIEEERRFWAAYDEYLNQNPAHRFLSTRIQQYLGQETFWRHREFTAEDFNRIFNSVMNEGARLDIRVTTGMDDFI